MSRPSNPAVVLVRTPPAPDERRLRGVAAEALVLTGPDAAQHAPAVARSRPDLPLLVVTGAADRDAAMAGLLASADEVLPPATTVGELVDAVEHAIARRVPGPGATDAGGIAEPASPERLEAVGRLAGGIGHEFNNLLLVIAGGTEILRQHLPPAGQLDAAFHRIADACDRAATLTRQLLAFGRQQALLASPLDVNVVIAELVPDLEAALGPRVHLVTHLMPDLAQVRVDVAQIRDVLLDLAAIASRAMPEGGTFSVETDTWHTTEAARAGRPWLRPGEYVRLRVRDTGRGLAAETLPHLFDPFYLPEGVTGGWGLTLSSVYGVVKQSGGYIWVESRMDEGMAVTILLPPVAAADVPAVAPTPQPRTAPFHVLLVDDLDGVRKVLASLLELRGFRVVAVRSAEDALKPGVAASIDILLTDVSLPGMSGPDLARQLRRERPGLPVLFMSGHPASAMTPDDLTDLTTFLQKPFSTQTLVERLHDLLRRAGA